MRLALRTGWVNVNRMLETISATDLLEWAAFDAIDPIGDERADVAAAIIAAATLAPWAKGGRGIHPRDLLPRYDNDEDLDRDSQILRSMMAWAAMTGGLNGRTD